MPQDQEQQQEQGQNQEQQGGEQQQQQQATERPEWLPENLWDATANKPVDFTGLRQPAADLPEGADKYALPTLEGIELDPEDPLLPILREHAFAAGIGQEGFAKVVGDYATKLKELDDAAHTAAITAIGDNAEGRIRNVSTWLDGKLPADEATSLKALTSDPKAMLGLERLMNAGAGTAPRIPTPPANERKTRDQIREIMSGPEYSGRPSERKQSVVDEVTKWFAEQAAIDAKAQAPAA